MTNAAGQLLQDCDKNVHAQAEGTTTQEIRICSKLELLPLAERDTIYLDTSITRS